MENEYKTICDHCRNRTWYDKEQPCKMTISKACNECGHRLDKSIPCPGTLRVIDYSDLDARLTPYYKSGERILITYDAGFSIRCYVGKSGGWKPIYLEILKRNSDGGAALSSDGIKSIVGLGKYKDGR